jgi:hypothetical protein
VYEPHTTTTQVAVAPAVVDDVVATLRFAGAHNLSVVARAHAHSTFATCDANSIMLATQNLEQGTVTIDPTSQTATILGCVEWGTVYKKAAEFGFVTVGGDCTMVATCGYVQAGGYGMMGRAFGTAADNVLQFTVVLAEGKVVNASLTENSDLFWALRGSGAYGSFGVIVGSVLQLHRVPQATDDSGKMLTGVTCWAASDAVDVIGNYSSWMKLQSNAYYDAMTMVNAPAPSICLFSTYVGPQSEGQLVLEGLSKLISTPPINHQVSLNTQLEWATAITATQLPTHSLNGYIKSLYFEDMSREVADVFVNYLAASPVSIIIWHHIGGQISDFPSNYSAYAYRNASYCVGVTSAGFPIGMLSQMQELTTSTWKALKMLGGYGAYPNFADPLLDNWQEEYYSINYPALQKIKATYDPMNFFRGPQRIEA